MFVLGLKVNCRVASVVSVSGSLVSAVELELERDCGVCVTEVGK